MDGYHSRSQDLIESSLERGGWQEARGDADTLCAPEWQHHRTDEGSQGCRRIGLALRHPAHRCTNAVSPAVYGEFVAE